ncbi:hypothetical protein DFH06DRAFT_1325199 [Mycena polygramma]|nr:hypothetical protein DFH06DRAFT_1325199 [Mycena polygramma]
MAENDINSAPLEPAHTQGADDAASLQDPASVGTPPPLEEPVREQEDPVNADGSDDESDDEPPPLEDWDPDGELTESPPSHLDIHSPNLPILARQSAPSRYEDFIARRLQASKRALICYDGNFRLKKPHNDVCRAGQCATIVLPERFDGEGVERLLWPTTSYHDGEPLEHAWWSARPSTQPKGPLV